MPVEILDVPFPLDTLVCDRFGQRCQYTGPALILVILARYSLS